MVIIRSHNFKDVVEKYTHSPATFATCRVLVVQIFLEIGSSGDCRNIHVPKHKTQVSNLWDAEGETKRGKHNMYEEQGRAEKESYPPSASGVPSASMPSPVFGSASAMSTDQPPS
jgi:hypothetical protein